MKNYAKKDLIVFDLDGTLTASKSNLTADMSRALTALLKEKKVAVIGGGTYQQFQKQFIKNLKCPPTLLSGLFLFPTTATSFYRYKKGWKKVYVLEIPKAKRAKIIKTFHDVLREVHYVHPEKVYGKVIEDRKTQVTFSALGQDIVTALGAKGVRMKEQWRKENENIKKKIADMMQKRLPDLEVRRGGITSIDITRKGIDKAYGVYQIEKILGVPIKNMVFIGDALYPGGNDHAAKRSGIECVPVRGPKDTKHIIEGILKR